MSNLQSIIEKAADAFAREIIAAVKAATLQELLAVQGVAVATVVTAAKRRGRPPKAKPGRKPGRPAKATAAKATAKKIAKRTAKTSANKKRSINYPKCSVPGCGKNRYSKGNGMCGAHFKAAQAATPA